MSREAGAARVAERFRRLLGRPPGRPAAAAPAVERRFSWEGVVVEKWRFAGAREEIPAYFLAREDLAAPAPGVLALHPHGRQFELGKSLVAGLAGEPSRAYGLAAARAGFAALIPDLPGFEERRPPLAERKASHSLQGEAYERLLAMQALLEGATLQGWIQADVSWCLDVLLADARVDPGRVGVLGQSFGGQEAVLSLLLEPRLAAGVSSCGFSLVRLLVERRLLHNMALYVPGLLPDLDFDELVPAIAPRPLLVIAGREDPIFPVEGVREIEARARQAWSARGAGDRLRFHYLDGGHDLPAPALQEALRWLGQALAAFPLESSQSS